MESNRLINIVGWYGKDNIGDESYKIAFKKIWPHENMQFTDFPLNAHQYILGGGDILSHTFTSKLLKINKPKHIMSVSLSSSVEKENLIGYKNIWVRDHDSLLNAHKKNIQAEYVPDFAFILDPEPNLGTQFIKDFFKKEKLDLYSKVIGIVVNSHLMPSHDSSPLQCAKFEKFCWEISNFMDNYPASFIFIPFGSSFPWDDRAFSSYIASKCKFWKKNAVIYDRLNVQQTLNIISSLDMLISTRLHSSIFSIVGNTPFIDITHNHKNFNLLKTIKKEDYSIKYDEFNKGSCVLKSDYLINNKKESDLLKEIANAQKIIIQEKAKNISFM